MTIRGQVAQCQSPSHAALPLPPSASPVGPTARYVAPGAACQGSTPYYATVQAAVDAAADGDVVKIAAGTYSDVHQRQGSSQVVHIIKGVTLRGGYSVAGGVDLDCCGGSTPVVGRNLIVDNRGGAWGGGVTVNGTNARLVNNIIARNEATKGAGIWMDGASGYPTGVTMTHNTLVGTPAADGICADDQVIATLANDIVAGFTVGISNTSPSGSTATAQATLFYGDSIDHSGGVSSTAEVWGNPTLLVPGAGHYHVGPSSAAINRGQDSGPA